MIAQPGATAADAPVLVRRHTPGQADQGRLLLLHGLANSSTVWHPFLANQRAGWEAWTADLPWRGDGDPGWCYRADLLDYVAEALGGVPDGADVVVAHSFAANLVLAWLDRDLARGVDPVASHGLRGVVLASPFFRSAPEQFTWAAMAHYLNDFHLIMAEGIQVHAGRRLRPELAADMAARLCERVGPYGWVRFFQTYLDTPWLRPEMITAPCLVIVGDRDTTASPEESVALAARLAHSRLTVLPDCGHFLMVEQSAAFAAAVEGFLRRLPPRNAHRRAGENLDIGPAGPATLADD